MRKIVLNLQEIRKSVIEASIPDQAAAAAAPFKGSAAEGGSTDWKPVAVPLEDELKEAGDEVTERLREAQRKMVDDLDLSQYVIISWLFLSCLKGHN